MANYILGQRTKNTDEDWLEVYYNIEKYVSKAEIDIKIREAVEEIKGMTKNRKAAFGWSGGKDSNVLNFVMNKAGISNCMWGRCNLEYPIYEEWVQKNKPVGLEEVNMGQDMAWLYQNYNMLFPSDRRVVQKWFKIVQQKAQRIYMDRNGLDIFILGRRTQDGNYTGKVIARKDSGSCYKPKTGIWMYCPIRAWKHEDILAVIKYYKLELPPTYFMKDGFQLESIWARKQVESEEQGWRDIYDIDKRILYKAKNYFSLADKILKEKEYV